jgi:prophage tail gpP-like protein
LTNSTPTASTGQYKGSTLSQIANAITKPYGIAFKLKGDNLAGTEKPFERVSIHWGETALQAIERLARFRNVHLVDDEHGDLVALRASASATSIADLVEGKNIEQAHLIMNRNEGIGQYEGVAQQFGTDQHHSDDARDIHATAKNPAITAYRPSVVVAEMTADKQDLVHRLNFEVATNMATIVEAHITVPGWLHPGGKLWCEHMSKPVMIYAPSLFPTDLMQLWIKGVKHRQSNEEGTISIIECCLENALSAGKFGDIGTDSPEGTPQAAAPSGSDGD